jgi:uncharacterized tellurite resistance protein B-like protein
MWGKVSELLGLKADAAPNNGSELHLATAALLVHVSLVDDEFAAEERQSLLDCLQDQFSLDKAVAEQILADAELEQREASCLYRFTHVITGELDQEGRQEIVRLLWLVAFSDNQLDNFESNLLAKVAGLLGVSTEDRIRIKHEVMAG